MVQFNLKNVLQLPDALRVIEWVGRYSFTSIARLIWNAEIRVSVAIHCYEHLF